MTFYAQPITLHIPVATLKVDTCRDKLTTVLNFSNVFSLDLGAALQYIFLFVLKCSLNILKAAYVPACNRIKCQS